MLHVNKDSDEDVITFMIILCDRFSGCRASGATALLCWFIWGGHTALTVTEF